MRSVWINIFYFCFIVSLQAQQFTFKSFVKKDRVLFRLGTNSKADLDHYKQWTLKITRTENGSEEKLIVAKLKPYSVVDTIKWPELFAKDKNKFSFVYQVLFANKSTGKDPKLNAKNEKMAFDLLMLSCDFDKEVAKACGLYFVDSTIQQGKQYVYKIAVYTSSSTTREFTTVPVNTSQLSSNSTISDLSATKRFRFCELKWRADHLTSEYGGYYAERSEDSINFIQLNKQPLILNYTLAGDKQRSIFYRDSMPHADKKYYYRVRGINFFGELSPPSNCVRVFSSKEIRSNPLIDSMKVKGNRDVFLRWRMEKQTENDVPDKYLVLRSENEKTGYLLIHESKKPGSFLDKNISSTCYYKIKVVTTGGDTLTSFSRMAVIYDTIPPEIPTGLKAVCDKNGNVHVSWNSSKEQNLSGYKLFRNNSLNEEPAQINSHFIKDTFYNEKLKLNNLSRKVYYAIAATDGNLNTSKLCAFIEVRKPDTLAPIKPILLSISPHTFGIKLKMNLSEEEDVKEHCIMRKENKFQETEIKNWKREDTLSVFLDSTAIPGRTYSYRLRSSDEDGNRSFSEELSIRYETGYRKKLNDFNVSVDRKRKEIFLSWNYNENKIEKFIIYRKKGDGKLTILKTLEGNERAYRDDTPQMGNFYEYRIKAVMEDGVESIISDGVKVEY